MTLGHSLYWETKSGSLTVSQTQRVRETATLSQTVTLWVCDSVTDRQWLSRCDSVTQWVSLSVSLWLSRCESCDSVTQSVCHSLRFHWSFQWEFHSLTRSSDSDSSESSLGRSRTLSDTWGWVPPSWLLSSDGNSEVGLPQLIAFGCGKLFLVTKKIAFGCGRVNLLGWI